MATQPRVMAGGPRQLVLVAALVGVLVLLLGLVVVRPLLSGGDDADPIPTAPSAAAAPTTTPQLINPSTTLAVPGATVGSVKDPFQPLVTPGAAATPAESGLTTTPADGGTTGATPTTIAATPSTVPGAGTGTASTPGGGASAERKVTLASISGGAAKVSVDGTSYTVEEGDRFADNYRAVDINTECATFESGSTPFTLCEGEAVLK
jgi:hypothetical protein